MMNSKSYLLTPATAFMLLVSFAACGDSDDPGADAGTMGGASGSGGNAGTATGSGGNAGSAAGSGGSSGGAAGSGSAGAAGSGTAGSAGKGGSGGVADSGTADSGGDADSGHVADVHRDTAVDNAPSEPPVNLGTAGTYAILAKAGISTVPASAITGNIGVSPAAGTYITGFSLIADSTTVFSTSTQVTGRVYAADYTAPTPSNLTTAVSDMLLAFTDASGRAAGVTELGAGNIGGMNITPGVYKWGTSLLIPSSVTLTGNATDVWIFQIAQDLTIGNAASVLLAGGALPKNIFWQVAGLVDVGTTAHCEGVLLSQTAVTLHTGASVNGRLLAQTAVAIDTSTIVAPAP
ncbi:MAG TPA: ice-binding family protein [Polyangiaceae bacterium]|nr:ice-binding family protein [Polyangiaceae bacterium]